LKKYKDENKKLPYICNKNIIIKKIGYWLDNKKKNYKNNKNNMKNEEIKKEWNLFINDEKYSIYF